MQRRAFNALPGHVDDRHVIDCGSRCEKCNYLRDDDRRQREQEREEDRTMVETLLDAVDVHVRTCGRLSRTFVLIRPDGRHYHESLACPMVDTSEYRLVTREQATELPDAFSPCACATPLTHEATELAAAAVKIRESTKGTVPIICPDPSFHTVEKAGINDLSNLLKASVRLTDLISPDRGDIVLRALDEYPQQLRDFVAAVVAMETGT